MLNLPTKFILYDSEVTSWEGAMERKWGGPNEHREIIEIGAIKVDNAELSEEGSILKFIKPRINPVLSDYIIKLTGVTQEITEEKGEDPLTAIMEFKEWCGDLPIYSFGLFDRDVMIENCTLLNMECPFPSSQFNDVREFFKSHGIPADEYMSSTIVEAFGEKAAREGHDALNDARTILDGLRLLENKINGDHL